MLAENPGELLPTIRSRSSIFRLGALPPEQIEAVLAEHRKDWKPKQRALVARLAEGAVGQALGFDLEAYLASRQDALILLQRDRRASRGDRLWSSLSDNQTYRAGAEGQQKTSALLHSFASLLEDLLLLHSGAGHLIRNIDLMAELTRVSQTITVAWIEAAVRGLDQWNKACGEICCGLFLSMPSPSAYLPITLEYAIFRRFFTVKPGGSICIVLSDSTLRPCLILLPFRFAAYTKRAPPR